MKIIDRLYEFSTEEIVQKAWEGLVPNLKNGICAYDPKKNELVSISLGQNEWIPGDDRIYLYTIDSNVFGNAVYNIEGDILTEEEYEEFKRLGYDDVEKYLEEQTDDTFDGRFFDFLVWCAEEELDLERVVKEHFERGSRK